MKIIFLKTGRTGTKAKLLVRGQGCLPWGSWWFYFRKLQSCCITLPTWEASFYCSSNNRYRWPNGTKRKLRFYTLPEVVLFLISEHKLYGLLHLAIKKQLGPQHINWSIRVLDSKDGQKQLDASRCKREHSESIEAINCTWTVVYIL